MTINVEFLVRSFDSTHSDPVINAQGCHKKGDIIDVQLAGFQWGKEELNKEKFYVISATGVPVNNVSELKKYIKPHIDASDPDSKKWKTIKRHLFRVRIEDLPDIEKIFTWDQIKGFIRNKATGQDEV